MALTLPQIVVPIHWRQTVLAVIGGYIDGSNLHDGADLICVGGCAAITTDWPAWQAKWDELLAFSGLRRWHHTDFMNHVKRPKRGEPPVSWNEGEWLIARRMLCEAFEATKPTCFAATVRRADYDDLGRRYELPEDPYYFLLDRAMHRLIQGMFQAPVDDGVAVYCDQDKDENLVHALAKWHTDRVHSEDHHWHPELLTRKVVTSYGSNFDYPPLQAADVVAHEIMRFATSNPDMPFLAADQDSGSWILERLKGQSPWFVMCFSKNWLERELAGRMFAKGHDPGFGFAPAEPRDD